MEKLICDKCKKEFEGIRDGEGNPVLCPECYMLPVVAEGDAVPSDVDKEMDGGKGED